MRPCARSLRAAPFPSASRYSAASALSATVGPPELSRRERRYTKSELTLSSLLMRRIASARSEAIDATKIFLESRASARSGIVSVTTSSLSGDSSMRFTAGPESTGCVMAA